MPSVKGLNLPDSAPDPIHLRRLNSYRQPTVLLFHTCPPQKPPSRVSLNLQTHPSFTMTEGDRGPVRPPTPLRKGCWTCVVRHKRCDNAFPHCQLCTRLGVPCAGYDEEKPDWFDAGDKLAKYKEELKDIIKDNRRHRKGGSHSRASSPVSVQMEWSTMWTANPDSANLGYCGGLQPTTYTMVTTSPPLASHHPEAFFGHTIGFIPSPQPEQTHMGQISAPVSWKSTSSSSSLGAGDNEALIIEYFDRFLPSMTPLMCTAPSWTEKGHLLQIVNTLHIFRSLVLSIARQTLNLPHDDIAAPFPSFLELTQLYEDFDAAQGSDELAIIDPLVKNERQIFTLDHYIYALVNIS